MKEILERFRAASEVAAKLIEEGYTEVSVGMEQEHCVSTVIFNSVRGDTDDVLNKVSPSPVVCVTVKASKSF